MNTKTETKANEPDVSNASKNTTATTSNITSVTDKIPLPEQKNNRGAKFLYPFDKMTEVGMSFGVKDKTKAGMASNISNANRRFSEFKTDENGDFIYQTIDKKDDHGKVVKVPTSKREKIVEKHFFAKDVDPKTDLDGASVRVFRDQ